MQGVRKRTPIPKREVEEKTVPASPVVTYTLSPEEMEKMGHASVKKVPATEVPIEDAVNHPAHYTAGDVECIDAIEAAITGLTGIEAYCTGNAMKYLWRWSQKNGKEDLQKAHWHLERLIAQSRLK